MDGKKIAGIVIFVLGVIGLIVSLLADVIDVGPLGNDSGFGMQQTTGTIIGVVFIAVGSFLTFKK
jgi:hypothetical protein